MTGDEKAQLIAALNESICIYEKLKFCLPRILKLIDCYRFLHVVNSW